MNNEMKWIDCSSEHFLVYKFDLKKAIRVTLDDKSKFSFQVVSEAGYLSYFKKYFDMHTNYAH